MHTFQYLDNSDEFLIDLGEVQILGTFGLRWIFTDSNRYLCRQAISKMQEQLFFLHKKRLTLRNMHIVYVGRV